MDRLLNITDSKKGVISLAFIQLLSIVLAVVFEQLFISLIPSVLVILMLAALDTKYFYYLLALALPFSMEIELPGGLGTDLPSEQMMWMLTGIGIIYLASKPEIIKSRLWYHPISLLVIAHIMWIALTVVLSQNVVISAKFLLAKIWYVVPFFFLFSIIHKDSDKVLAFFKVLIVAMATSITIVMIRHAGYGFSFKSINEAVHPIFRNHVNYACMLVALIPYVWAIYRNNRSRIWLFVMLLFLAAIYLSFTRAAMVAFVIGIGTYFIIKWKLARPAIVSVVMIVVIAVPYLLHNNKYLDYAPEYERAIAHYKFDNLIEATYKFEDISTMERLYRWVAGKEMVVERPFFGFGPGTFYSYYQDYSIAEFQTYVSDNPEKSGIHNYYLMTMVEQGVPGFLIFFLLVIAGVVYGEKAYQRIKSKKDRDLVMASIVSLVIISSIIIINDMVETDKVGPFFFVALGVIMLKGVKSKILSI